MRTAPPSKSEDRLLLILQYWKGDRDQAMRMMKFVTDLQPGKCENADVLLMSRFDCGHDQEMVDYISRKFRVFTHISKRRGTGWPNGCNDLWFASVEWMHCMIEARKVPAYKAALTFEADCVPLASNWVTRLSRAWDDANKNKLTFVLGPMLKSPGPHINGNMLISGNPAFTHWVTRKVGGAPATAGWDYVMYQDFRRWGAQDCPIMRSYWGSKTFPRAAFEAELAHGTVFVHGVKDDSLLNMSRKHFLG